MCYDWARKRSACSVGVNAVEAYRQPQEQAAGILAMRWRRSSQERVTTEACQGMWPTNATGGATVQLEEEATPVGRVDTAAL
jgi:hypothetical protein